MAEPAPDQPPPDAAEPAASVELAPLPREQVGPFLVLGVPKDEGWNMACCVTFGYPLGKWGVAARVPVEDVSYSNHWGNPLPFDVNGPLWP